MIQSFYEHGGDQPASGLSLAQIAGASRDAAGTLWVDLESPTANERSELLVNILAVEASGFAGVGPDAPQGLVRGPRHARLTARVPVQQGEHGQLSTLVLYVGPNFVVTEHTGLALIRALRERSVTDLPAGGALGTAAVLLDSVAGACAARLTELDAALSGLEAKVVSSAGQDTGRRLYDVRRELETMSESLPALAEACRELVSANLAPALGNPVSLEPQAQRLERLARVGRRMRRRGDLAMSAHAAELAALTARWLRVAAVTVLVIAAYLLVVLMYWIVVFDVS